MPMTEQQWTVLAHYLRSTLPRAAPDWTTSNSHDPGITVLEVLNYALTDLQLRRPLDDSARSLAEAAIQRAASLSAARRGRPGGRGCPARSARRGAAPSDLPYPHGLHNPHPPLAVRAIFADRGRRRGVTPRERPLREQVSESEQLAFRNRLITLLIERVNRARRAARF